MHLLPTAGSALDVACGIGGNGILLASHGLETSAWDVSDVAVDAINRFASNHYLPLTGAVRDAVTDPPAPGSVDVIACTRFLDRSLCPALAAALKPGGLLFYQTFTRLRVHGGGPSNPDYLLKDGELLSLFPTLSPVIYVEERDLGDIAQGFRDQAMLVALRSA
nr:class I SAM-dependent methyltransferase [Natronocella acetinitrilica]